MNRNLLTQERLKELLYYNPQFGIFVRRVATSSSIKVGDIAGSLTRGGYMCFSVNRRLYLAHRLVFLYMEGEFPPNQVDHINGCRADNTWLNIRHATHQDNMRNAKIPKTNKSGVIGVFFNKPTGKWRALIKVNGKQTHLGYFTDFDDAVLARKSAEIEHGFHPNHGRSNHEQE